MSIWTWDHKPSMHILRRSIKRPLRRTAAGEQRALGSMAEKLEYLLRMSRCYMLVQDHRVLDMTERGTWATLCQHILGLPATRGEVDPAATLVFCDRELELGNPLLWGACNKRIVSTCLHIFSRHVHIFKE